MHSQYGIYTTRIENGPGPTPGPPVCVCDIRRRNHQIKDVDIIGGDSRVKLIYSPGIELEPQEP